MLHILTLATPLRTIDRLLLLVNIAFTLMLLVYATDLALFYLLYETLAYLLLPALTTSTKSVRKSYALTMLYWVNAIGLATFIMLVALEVYASTSSSTYDHYRTTLWSTLVCIIVLAKTPTYPLLFWLPEAHVECAWPGSVILACLLLKVSIYATVMYTLGMLHGSATGIVVILSTVSLLWATLAIASTADTKRIGALLSIVHMNAGLLATLSSGATNIHLCADLWLSHSVGALAWFYACGIYYAITGTRSMLATGAYTPLSYTILVCTLFTMLPLPTGMLYAPELYHLALLLCVSTGQAILYLTFSMLTLFTTLIVYYTRASALSDCKEDNKDATSICATASMLCMLWLITFSY